MSELNLTEIARLIQVSNATCFTLSITYPNGDKMGFERNFKKKDNIIGFGDRENESDRTD